MTIWIGTKPKRARLFVMLLLILAVLAVTCIMVFAMPGQVIAPCEYGEPVPIVLP